MRSKMKKDNKKINREENIPPKNWWNRNKSLITNISIILTIISSLAGLNFLLYQFVLVPHAEIKILTKENEYILKLIDEREKHGNEIYNYKFIKYLTYIELYIHKFF